MDAHFTIALILTLLAGMSTVVGGFMTFFVKRNNLKALSVGLGFSAGVMVYISLTEIMNSAKIMLDSSFGDNVSRGITFISFFLGILIAILIDYFIPDHIESDLLEEQKPEQSCCRHNHRIKRAGVITAIAIAVHNFPEGLATFLVSSQDLSLGVPVAIAIAIHNIPEGIAVALPIYHASGKKRQAIWYSFMSGISEPIGGLLGILLLKTFMPQWCVGAMFAAVAGIMVYISFDTLLPMAREYGENHHVITGIVAGMFVIGLSLLLI